MPDLNDEAAASVIAFAVAAGIFLFALSALFLFAQTHVPVQATQADPLGHVAATGLASSMFSRGTDSNWDTTSPGWNGASGVPGLAQAPGPAAGPLTIQLAKVRALQADSTLDPTLTYEEAWTAFGLAADQDFHVRSQPALTGTPTWPASFTVNYVPGTLPPAGEASDLQKALDASSTPIVTVTSGPFPTLPSSCAPGTPGVPDIVVVGTGYNGAASGNLRTWIECGGTLILLPSSSCCATEIAGPLPEDSGPLRQTDGQHPALNVPNVLAPSSYVAASGSWPAMDGFTTVAGRANAPLLQVSDAGAYGSGTVILVGVAPTSVDGATATDAEGIRLFQNLLLRHFHELYLDWGPPIPDSSDAAPSVLLRDLCWTYPSPPPGTCSTVGSNLGTERIPIQVAVYVFPR